MPEGNRITQQAEILHNQLRDFNVIGKEKGYSEDIGKDASHAAASASVYYSLCSTPIQICAPIHD